MIKKPHHQELGRRYEKIACEYLINNNLKLLESNYHCRHGELDLIMLDINTIVFVEVKYRKNVNYGSPIECITKTKQLRILKSAHQFLINYPKFAKLQYRFDAVTINRSNLTRKKNNYIINSSYLINGLEINWYNNIITIDNELKLI